MWLPGIKYRNSDRRRHRMMTTNKCLCTVGAIVIAVAVSSFPLFAQGQSPKTGNNSSEVFCSPAPSKQQKGKVCVTTQEDNATPVKLPGPIRLSERVKRHSRGRSAESGRILLHRLDHKHAVGCHNPRHAGTARCRPPWRLDPVQPTGDRGLLVRVVARAGREPEDLGGRSALGGWAKGSFAERGCAAGLIGPGRERRAYCQR